MRIYLDDNITDRRVIAELRRAGHEVMIPAEAGHDGALDAQHLAHAIRHNYVLLTQDHKDFTALHDRSSRQVGSTPGFSSSITTMIQPATCPRGASRGLLPNLRPPRFPS